MLELEKLMRHKELTVKVKEKLTKQKFFHEKKLAIIDKLLSRPTKEA
jgi:hypothetical protein